LIFIENIKNWLGCFFTTGIVEGIETSFERYINFLYSESFFDTANQRSSAGGMRKAHRRGQGAMLCWRSLIGKKNFGVLFLFYIDEPRSPGDGRSFSILIPTGRGGL
jgi:hypothetical protein